jgi:uncharacterized membrane protein YphA (DoxX/SURF4 family)
MDRALKLLAWLPALYIAWVLLWYEQYKLTGNEGSVFLFTTLTDWLFLHGHEKAMRLAVASAEIAASLLVLVPATRLYGALLALGIMTGAIFFHLVSPLGIDPYDDGAALFIRACCSWVSAAFIVVVYRHELAALVKRFTGLRLAHHA